MATQEDAMLTLNSFDRWKASGLHLLLSALIAATVVALVAFVWYPRPYFEAMGGGTLLRLLIGVDVVLGPLITLIIFKPGKPRLKLDLATIAVLQLAALAYGSYIMFEARPVYNVFVRDRFETIPANDLDGESLARAGSEFRDLPMAGPRVVAASPPANPEESVKIAMGAMAGGPDISKMPHLYKPYDAAAADAARAAKPLQTISRQGRAEAQAVTDFVSAHGNNASNLGYLPVRARNKDFAMIVDRKTGQIVGSIAVNPW
jgi:hypothetical protein